MPLSKYFGGKGAQVMADLQREHGAEAGKRIFYATHNKMKKKKRTKAGEQAEALEG